MRTEKELWELVLSRPGLFETGLCFWVYNMHRHCDIRLEEYFSLKKALEIGLPQRCDYGLFCWPPFQIGPRIEWIKKRIEEL